MVPVMTATPFCPGGRSTRFAGRVGKFAQNRLTYRHRPYGVCDPPSQVRDRDIRVARDGADACSGCGDSWRPEDKVHLDALRGILAHLTDAAKERVPDPGGLEAVASVGEDVRGIHDGAPRDALDDRTHEHKGAQFVPLNRWGELAMRTPLSFFLERLYLVLGTRRGRSRIGEVPWR